MSVSNVFTPATTIVASQVNANFSDFATEMTNSLPRDGQAGMTGQLKAADGSLALPGWTWTADPNTGLRRTGADAMAAVAGGVDIFDITTAGLAMQPGKTLSTDSITVGGGPIVPPGTMWPSARANTTTGWLLCSGLTIGSATSGAGARANADTEDLFTVLWEDYSDTTLPIFTSAGAASTRGADAATDFAANKRMSLPDMRGRGFFGRDDMGGITAGRITSAGSGMVGTTLGVTGGAQNVTLAALNMPNISPTVTDNGHRHQAVADEAGDGTALSTNEQSMTKNRLGAGDNAYVLNRNASGDATIGRTSSVTTGISVAIDNAARGGAQTAVNNMPPAFIGNWIIKL